MLFIERYETEPKKAPKRRFFHIIKKILIVNTFFFEVNC